MKDTFHLLIHPPGSIPMAIFEIVLSGEELSLRKDTTAAVIKLYGATVISWQSEGVEKLYMSPKAILDNTAAIRGGIPIVFPQFGQPQKTMKSHGFARNSMWKLESQEASDYYACVKLFL